MYYGSRQWVVAEAANIKGGSDSKVEIDEFLQLYPQFCNESFPKQVIELMLDNANASIRKPKWHEQWKLGVCLHTAHYLTMWAKTFADPYDTTLSAITHKGDSNGALSSKSVGGVSVSYGSTSADGDLAGYGSLRDTIYGQQLASMARMIGKGLMVVR